MLGEFLKGRKKWSFFSKRSAPEQGFPLPVAGSRSLGLGGAGNCHLQVHGRGAEPHSRFLHGEQDNDGAQRHFYRGEFPEEV